ncbi:hypothetical protein GCM10023190_09340 [Enteractinococcus fodinae]
MRFGAIPRVATTSNWLARNNMLAKSDFHTAMLEMAQHNNGEACQACGLNQNVVAKQGMPTNGCSAALTRSVTNRREASIRGMVNLSIVNSDDKTCNGGEDRSSETDECFRRFRSEQ